MYRDADGALVITGRGPAYVPDQAHIEEMQRRASGIYPTSVSAPVGQNVSQQDAGIGWFELSSYGRKIEIKQFDSTEIIYQDDIPVCTQVYNSLLCCMAPETHPARFDEINALFLREHLMQSGPFAHPVVSIEDSKAAVLHNTVFEMVQPCRETVRNLRRVSHLRATGAPDNDIKNAITNIKLVWKAEIGSLHRSELDKFCAKNLRNPPLLQSQQSFPNGAYRLVPIAQPETFHFVYSSSKRSSPYQVVAINLVLKFQILYSTNGHDVPFNPPRKVVLNLHLVPPPTIELEPYRAVTSMDELWNAMLNSARQMGQDRMLAEASLIEMALPKSASNLEVHADNLASADEETGPD